MELGKIAKGYRIELRYPLIKSGQVSQNRREYNITNRCAVGLLSAHIPTHKTQQRRAILLGDQKRRKFT